ncbi:MAG: hypothetical protein BYD32DRAFT_242736 [Podila humilis]|nr:MAG: hypothetical protein BYD32DRAFT_242736 [Podila humilis]
MTHSRHHDVPLVLLAVLAPVVVLGDDEPAAAASVLPNRLSCVAVEGGWYWLASVSASGAPSAMSASSMISAGMLILRRVLF